MKKIYVWFIAIGLLVFIFTGAQLIFNTYISDLSDLPDWTNFLTDLRTSTNNLSSSWSATGSDFSLLNLGNLISNFFNTIWNLFILPFKFLFYLVESLFILFPIFD